MKIRHINHIGIVVNDMVAAKEFFVDLGLTVAGETSVQGDLVDRIIGLKGTLSDIVMLQAPDGQLNLELSKIHNPIYDGDDERAPANKPGLRHIAFEVDDIDEIVGKLKHKGTEFFSKVQTYENSYKLCYLRGPEGIIIELAEAVGQ